MEWHEVDILGFLESEPEIIESEHCGPSYDYKLSRHNLNLLLSVSPLEGDLSIQMNMAGIENPIFEYVLLDCERIKVVKSSEGNELLELKVSGSVYIHISVRPSINIKVGGNAL